MTPLILSFWVMNALVGSSAPEAIANVDNKRQRLSPRLFDLVRRRVNRTGQLGMGLGRLRRDNDVGAVCRRLLGDFEADAARGARDENGVIGQAANVRDFRHVLSLLDNRNRTQKWDESPC